MLRWRWDWKGSNLESEAYSIIACKAIHGKWLLPPLPLFLPPAPPHFLCSAITITQKCLQEAFVLWTQAEGCRGAASSTPPLLSLPPPPLKPNHHHRPPPNRRRKKIKIIIGVIREEVMERSPTGHMSEAIICGADLHNSRSIKLNLHNSFDYTCY